MLKHGNSSEITVSISKIYLYSIYILVPLLIAFGLPYVLMWKDDIATSFMLLLSKVGSDWNSIILYIALIRDIFIISLLIIAGAILHELLHGIVWVIYSRKGFSILRFGIMRPDMSPYVHCTEPLPVWVYRIGIILPAVVLGLIPMLIGLFSGYGKIFLLGFFFTWAASGDIIILWLIRELGHNTIVRDHPRHVGCIIDQS